MIDLPRHVWARLADASIALDELFTESSIPSHKTFCGYVKEFLRTSRTALFSVAGAVTVGGLYVLIHFHDPFARVAPGLIFFAFVGFWTGHSAYLIGITARLCQKIGTSEDLNLNAVTAIATPGLRGASHAMRTMAGLGLLLLFALSGSLVLRYLHNPSENSLVIIASCVTLGFLGVTLIGLQSQAWLAKPANEAKGRRIEILEPRITQLFAEASTANFAPTETAALTTVAGLQRDLISLPESYNDNGLLTAYIATAFGIFLQLVLAKLAG